MFFIQQGLLSKGLRNISVKGGNILIIPCLYCIVSRLHNLKNKPEASVWPRLDLHGLPLSFPENPNCNDRQ